MDSLLGGRSPIRVLLGLIVAPLALFCLAYSTYYLASDLAIWLFGRHTTGYVVDKWAEQTGRDGNELTFRYFVRYEFETSSGEIIGRDVPMGAKEWAGLGLGWNGPGKPGVIYTEQYTCPPAWYDDVDRAETSVGEAVEIAYFPLYPQHNRMDDSRFIPLLAVSYLPLVALTAVLLRLAWTLLKPPPVRQPLLVLSGSAEEQGGLEVEV